jgi:hypothetical protein
MKIAAGLAKSFLSMENSFSLLEIAKYRSKVRNVIKIDSSVEL